MTTQVIEGISLAGLRNRANMKGWKTAKIEGRDMLVAWKSERVLKLTPSHNIQRPFMDPFLESGLNTWERKLVSEDPVHALVWTDPLRCSERRIVKTWAAEHSFNHSTITEDDPQGSNIFRMLLSRKDPTVSAPNAKDIPLPLGLLHSSELPTG